MAYYLHQLNKRATRRKAQMGTKMGKTDFGALIEAQADHSHTIAGLRADLAYWKARAERSEFARQALEHHNAVLNQRVVSMLAEQQNNLPKAEAGTQWVSVAWSYLRGSSVDVMFSHEWAESEDPRVPSGWDVTIEDLRINGVDICDLWNELPKPVQMSLYRAVEAYLDGEARDARDSAAIDAYEMRRAA